MDIETLQIKVVKCNKDKWDQYKLVVPLEGEPVLIAAEGMTRQLVIGDGTSTLDALLTNPESGQVTSTVVNCDDLNNALDFRKELWNPKEAKASPEDPQNPDVSTPIGATSSLGDTDNNGGRFAYVDHTHNVTRDTLENILSVKESPTSNFRCRRIKAGVGDPPTGRDVQVGDIYIRFKK